MTKRINNAGVTLLELIVVITILGIVSGGVILSFGLKDRGKASGCANKLDTKLEQVKTEAMSKSQDTYFVLYKKSDGYYVASTSKVKPFTTDMPSEEKLGDNNMELVVTMDDKVAINIEDQTVGLRFDRASGAILPYSLITEEDVSEQKSFPSEIRITAGGRTSRIRIVAQTGKHYVE